LGKTYTNEEMVRKILQCLPNNKWDPNVTAIKEVQDLKTLALDDLIRKLLTHEIHLKEDEEKGQTKRGIVFKTTNEELHSSKDESKESDEDSTAMIARGLKKIFKSKRFDPKKLYKKGSSSKRHEKNSTGIETSNNKNETNLGPCFGCGLLGHIVKDCTTTQKKAEKRQERIQERNDSCMG